MTVVLHELSSYMCPSVCVSKLLAPRRYLVCTVGDDTVASADDATQKYTRAKQKHKKVIHDLWLEAMGKECAWNEMIRSIYYFNMIFNFRRLFQIYRLCVALHCCLFAVKSTTYKQYKFVVYAWNGPARPLRATIFRLDLCKQQISICGWNSYKFKRLIARCEFDARFFFPTQSICVRKLYKQTQKSFIRSPIGIKKKAKRKIRKCALNLYTITHHHHHKSWCRTIAPSIPYNHYY